MPETDVIPTSASIASTGKGIRYIGDHCYALSGDVSGTIGASGTALDFTSGSGYIDGRFYYTSNADTAGAQFTIVQIDFNGVMVLYSKERRDLTFNDTLWPIIIPPRTHVEVTYTTPGTTVETTIVFTGRVYGEK